MALHRFFRMRMKGLGTLLAGIAALSPLALTAAEQDSEGDLKAAIMRDLGLDEAQLGQRLEAERLAIEQDLLLRDVLADDFAGSWIDQDSLRLMVAVTQPRAAVTVESVGAKAVMQTYSLRALQQAHARFDDVFKGPSGAGFTAWQVDVKRNRVVIEALDASVRDVDAIAARAGVPADMVEIVQAKGQPVPLTTYYGGSMYHKNGVPHCSAGFAVNTGGFVTAGHCGTVGQNVTTGTGAVVGSFSASTFPDADMALVTLSAATAQPLVETFTGAYLPVKGSTAAPIGATVCRSGYSSGYQCGVIQAFNVTVNYAAGAVYGLTRSNACAWPGDSGGPFISANGHAQGVTSGGVLFWCDIYFQPIQPILAAYSTKLTLSGNAMPAGSAPSINWMQCPDMTSSGAGTFVCHVSHAGVGPTSVSWFVDGFFGGPANTYSSLHSYCTLYAPVSVMVRVANLHGSTTQYANFTCPSDWIP